MNEESFCRVPNCGKPVKTRGLCAAHYQTFRTRPDSDAGRETAKYAVAPTRKRREPGKKPKPGNAPTGLRRQTTPRQAGVMLNLAAVANRIREAATLLTGNEVEMSQHETGYLFSNTANTRLAYLDREGQVQEARIQIV